MNQVAAPFTAATAGGFTFSPSATPTPGAQGYTNSNNNHNAFSTPPPPGHQYKPSSLSYPPPPQQQQQQLPQSSQPFTNNASVQGFSQQQQPPQSLSPQAYGNDASMMGGANMSPQNHQLDSSQGFQHPSQQRQQQQQQQFAGQQPFMPFSTAPYQASTPATQAAAAQSIRQSQSTSPHHSLSPPASGPSLPQQPTPPNKFPMAAPPVPHTPAATQPNNHAAQAVQSPQTPQSPATQSREHQRVTLLLDINVELLQEVNRLQGEGKGGALSAQQQASLKSQNLPDHIASDEYIQCLRRVQANLSYLGSMTPRAIPDASKILPGPAFMTPPPHMPQLASRYDQLRDMFPGWPGHIQKGAQAALNSPNPNGTSAGSPVI